MPIWAPNKFQDKDRLLYHRESDNNSSVVLPKTLTETFLKCHHELPFIAPEGTERIIAAVWRKY
jgi:hypothetical protein